jgi:hypothetical protein
MAIERDPWIHPNLKGNAENPTEPVPVYESEQFQANLRANRSIGLGLLSILLQFPLYFVCIFIVRLSHGFMGPGIILCAPLTTVTVAICGLVLARGVMKETKYKSPAYDRAFKGQVLNVLSLLLAAILIILIILLLFFAIALSASWK